MSKKVTPKGTGVTREKNTFILKSVCHAAVASEIILPVLWSFLVVQSAVLVATLSPRRRGLHVKKNDSRQTTFIGIFIFRNASVWRFAHHHMPLRANCLELMFGWKQQIRCNALDKLKPKEHAVLHRELENKTTSLPTARSTSPRANCLKLVSGLKQQTRFEPLDKL